MQKIAKLLVGLAMLSSHLVQGQTMERPKLIVGIVVDQMRWDYLYRFNDRYSGGWL